MAAVTVRNIPDDVHRALKLRAKQHGRSTEAEIRAILKETVLPEERLKIGTELGNLGLLLAEAGYEIKVARDQTPAGSTVTFE